MIIYFAGADKIKQASLVKNILISFYGLKGISENLKDKNIFLDSGAYSAMTQRKQIDLNLYIAFIKENLNKIKIYAGLDVIGDHKKTIENQKKMERQGLTPLWTFHARGEPYDILKRESKKRDYIALGGTAGGRFHISYMVKHFDYCFSIIPKTCKVHGFGITNPHLLNRYPFYSVDSTSWNSGSRYRTLLNYKESRHKRIKEYAQIFLGIKGGGFAGQRKKGQSMAKEFIEYFNFALKGTADDFNERNILTTLKMERYFTDLWTKRGVVWNE